MHRHGHNSAQTVLPGAAGTGCDAPAGGQVLDEEEPAAGLGVRGRGGGLHGGVGAAFGAGVGHLDTEYLRRHGQAYAEVASRDVAVLHGVGAELAGDERERVVGGRAVGVAPGVQPFADQEPGEAGAAGCGREAHGELAVGVRWRLLVRGGGGGSHGSEIGGSGTPFTSSNACTGAGCTGCWGWRTPLTGG